MTDTAVAGWLTKALTGDYALTTANGASDEGRTAMLKFTGAGPFTVTIPSVSKRYDIWNACTGTVTITTGAGDTVAVYSGEKVSVICDGSNVELVQPSDMRSQRLTNVGAPTSSLDAATKKYVDDTAFSAAGGTLPGQTGNAGTFLTTNGSTASWGNSANYIVVSQSITLSGALTPPQITADQNDYNPTGLSTTATVRLTSDAARNITGLAAQSGGRLLALVNVGSFNITLVNGSASSLAANRFSLGQDFELRPGQSVMLRYDAMASLWYKVTTVTPSRTSDIRAGTSTSSFMSPGDTYNALAFAQLYLNGSNVVVTGSTLGTALDMSQFINGTVTLTANATLPTPINAKAGQTGVTEVIQGGAGNFGLTPSSFWKREGGAPGLSTAVGAKDYICFTVISPTLAVYGIIRSPS